MSLSIERYLAIRRLSSDKASKVLFWGPIIFTLAYNAPKFFELSTCEAPVLPTQQYPNANKLNLTENDLKNNSSRNEGLQQYSTKSSNINLTHALEGIAENDFADNGIKNVLHCGRQGVRATVIRQNEMYILFYVVISKVVLVEMIPWLIVLILNILTWKRMKLFQKRREAILIQRNTGDKFKYLNYRSFKYLHFIELKLCVYLFYIERNINQESRVLLVMAVLFVICEFFPLVGDVYELICTLKGYSADGACPYNVYIENCIHFGHFMLTLNSSVNFIFYMMNIVKFRQGFVKVNLS